jgi:hypothetical protein
MKTLLLSSTFSYNEKLYSTPFSGQEERELGHYVQGKVLF